MAVATQLEEKDYESAEIVDITPSVNYNLDEKILKEYVDSVDSEGNYLSVKEIARRNDVSEYKIYKIVNKSGVVKRSEMLNQGLKYVVAFENGYGMDDFTDKGRALFNEDRAEQIYLRTKERLQRGDKILNYRLKTITKQGEGELCRKLFQRDLSNVQEIEDVEMIKDEKRRLDIFNQYIHIDDRAQLLWEFTKSLEENPYPAKPERTSWNERLNSLTDYLTQLFKLNNIRKYSRRLADGLTGYLF
ncbi:MAG: hypothetical protein AABY22_17535 [Nanoarchaeota archaeon]